MYMRIEVGVDIIENSRFGPDILADEQFMDRFFSKAEQEYCNSQSSPGEHYAARFAAKEAVLKAFSGFGIRIRLWDVEVILDQLGVPRARVCDVLDDDDYEIKISISHSERESVGFAVVCIMKYE